MFQTARTTSTINVGKLRDPIILLRDALAAMSVVVAGGAR
jgi:hypothetical protein